MESSDDFERLGNAVARVLRETFSAAADARALDGRQFTDELARVLAEIRELPMRASAEQEAAAADFQTTLTEAKRSIDEMLATASAEAAAIRAQAAADAAAIVEGAGAEIARAKELVAEERVKLDGELKDLVRDVHRAVGSLETSARLDHESLLDRAASEARMILRQARLHHRSTAKEVDRMIEAAAEEAAALRKSALADAARVAARVRGVVDYPSEAEAEPRPPAWVRPTSSATAPEPVPGAPTIDEAVPGEVSEHRRRRLRPLAS
jgi:cell division septum initiation protein DivIVA